MIDHIRKQYEKGYGKPMNEQGKTIGGENMNWNMDEKHGNR